jgi:hypothetical protein
MFFIAVRLRLLPFLSAIDALTRVNMQSAYADCENRACMGRYQ